MTKARRLLLSTPFIFFLSLFIFGCNSRPGKPRVLIFSKASSSGVLPIDLQALLKQTQANEWLVDTTSDSSYFREDSLALYSAVVFLNVPGNTPDHYGQAD